jgi:hypothetical protein
MKIRRLSEALAARQTVHDADFDDLFPLAYRRVSARFWTPVETARRATDLLVREGAQRILDVGAGVGKFCIVGAATTARASFVGIEQRAHLVNVARDAAATLGVTDLEVVHGRLDQIDTSTFDGFYFFNPFAENILVPSSRLDDSVDFSEQRYRDDVKVARAILQAAPARTLVATYFGFGGQMPTEYERVHVERSRGGTLALWVKRTRARRASRVLSP